MLITMMKIHMVLMGLSSLNLIPLMIRYEDTYKDVLSDSTPSFQVGAAISTTYTTGQPIVFVGSGQTYQDLCTLNVQAVVSSLLK